MAYAMSKDVAGHVSTLDLPSWSGQDILIADVVKAVEDLRRNEQRAATRTSIATLVIVTRSPDEIDDAETVIDHLGVRHPARIITLLTPPEGDQGEDRIDGDVTLHAGKAAGHAIWSDEIRLKVSGGPSQHLASLLRPLTLSDLPVVVWYVRGLPNPNDPLLKLANSVVIDTKTAVDYGEGEQAILRVLKEVSRLSRKHIITDLSWHRLRPWRGLLAGQFAGEVFRPFAYDVERLEVSGKLGPRMLLAGWLGSRLHLDREKVHLYDGRHVSVTMDCRYEDRTAEFKVERMPEDRLVCSSVVIHDGPSHNELLSLGVDPLPESLMDALRRIERDRIYEQAIKWISAWSV